MFSDAQDDKVKVTQGIMLNKVNENDGQHGREEQQSGVSSTYSSVTHFGPSPPVF